MVKIIILIYWGLKRSLSYCINIQQQDVPFVGVSNWSHILILTWITPSNLIRHVCIHNPLMSARLREPPLVSIHPLHWSASLKNSSNNECLPSLLNHVCSARRACNHFQPRWKFNSIIFHLSAKRLSYRKSAAVSDRDEKKTTLIIHLYACPLSPNQYADLDLECLAISDQNSTSGVQTLAELPM